MAAARPNEPPWYDLPVFESRLSVYRGRLVTGAGALAALAAMTLAAGAAPRHAMAMHGEPALPEGFAHFRYVNPDAPKGGRMVQSVLGTFDSLNPFVVRGSPHSRSAATSSRA